MDESSYNRSTLEQRILQLEQERDELRLDIEQLCMQQSGIPSKADVSSQIQARRINGLQQELESWKQKLDTCTKKNHKLQDELAEVKCIKGHFADLLKSETDKSLELDKEIKFFQSEAANALIQRDQALMKLDESLENEKELIRNAHQLHNSLESTKLELFEQKKYCQHLQDRMKAQAEEFKRFQNVVNYFWKIRSKLGECEHVEELGDRATVLLQDSESSWIFGHMIIELENLHCQVKEYEATMVAFQEESRAQEESISSLQRQLEEETILKQEAKEEYFLLQEKLLHWTVVVEVKFKTLRSTIMGLKEEIFAMLREEEKWADSLLESWLYWTTLTHNSQEMKVKPNEFDLRTSDREDELHGMSRVAINSEASKPCKENCTSMKSSPGHDYDSQINDTKEALALALHDKVATLLLLSQQEERHILEENMVAARESKIADLQKQLLQVTIDKGKALIQVAKLSEELANVQEQQCELRQMCQCFLNDCTSDQTPSPTRSGLSMLDNRKVPRRRLESWLKGFDNLGYRIRGLPLLQSRIKGNASSLSRLEAENAALWDMLTRLQQLGTSVNQLRRMIGEVADRPNEHRDDTLQTIGMVIAESCNLRVALGGSFTELRMEVTAHTSDAEKGGEKCIVSAIGMVLLDCILFAAEILKTCVNEHTAFGSSSCAD